MHNAVETNKSSVLEFTGDSAYLVCFVVVLWVVFEDLCFLLVVEVGHQSVDTSAECRSPLLAVEEPSYESSEATLVLRRNSHEMVADAYICFDSSTLNLRALKNLSYRPYQLLVGKRVIPINLTMVKVSKRSLQPACSSIDRS